MAYLIGNFELGFHLAFTYFRVRFILLLTFVNLEQAKRRMRDIYNVDIGFSQLKSSTRSVSALVKIRHTIIP